MNGAFERCESYPYSIQPVGGYGKGSDRWEVIDIRSGQVISSDHPGPSEAALAIPQTQQRQA